tara:strand:+ start:113 stop:244 length:132 start_codon:yes stop_codon:yes gene_type:complete
LLFLGHFERTVRYQLAPEHNIPVILSGFLLVFFLSRRKQRENE